MRKSRPPDEKTEQVLKPLRGGGYVSGEAASASLGITRAAFWKRIETLRRKGFIIESRKGRGYRLVSAPELSAEELRGLVNGSFARQIHFHKQVDSTNDLAMELAEAGSPHGTVVVADSQRKGRGRLGRRWVSPPGANVYMSVILRPTLPLRDAPLLTLLCAVACARAVGKHTGLDVRIKWPNDIQVGGRKLGGILVEMRSEPDKVLYAVAGIVINVNMRSRSLPPQLRQTATSVLEEAGVRHRRTPIVAAILNEMQRLLKRESKEAILGLWRQCSTTIGRMVSITEGDETYTGKALDIDENGRLIVRLKDGKRRKFSSGDLIMLREG